MGWTLAIDLAKRLRGKGLHKRLEIASLDMALINLN